jgi:predicted ABC-type ATPase
MGYEVHFFFLWVPTVELALTSVKARVMGGGHDVSETVVRRRFDRCGFRMDSKLLAPLQSLSDSWALLDNSGTAPDAPDVIAFEKFASLPIMNQEIYDGLIARYGRP